VMGEMDILANFTLPQYLDGSIPRIAMQGMFAVIVYEVYPSEEIVMAYYPAPTGDPEIQFVNRSPLREEASHLVGDWVATYWDTLESSENYLVTPIAATASYQLYGLLVPVNNNGEFVGVLGIALDFAPVLQQYVTPMHSGEYGAAWVQDASGMTVWDHETDVIGLNATEIGADFPDVLRVNERMLSEDSGQDEYRFPVESGGDVERKLVAWNTVYMGDQRLTIALSAPSTEINAELRAYRQQTILLGVLLGATLIVSSGLFYTTRERVLERLVNERTSELHQLTGELEQRVAQRTTELDQERAQLKIILEAMEDSVIYRENGRIRYANPAMSRLLGYTLDELSDQVPDLYENKSFSTDQARSAAPYNVYADALKQNIIWRDTVKVQRKDGTRFDASMFVAPVHAQDGKPLGIVEIIRDISQEKALQEQKDRFITNASHELRRPLSNLKARLYLIRRQPDKLPDHLQVIQRATDDMTDLVQDLLDVAQFARDEIRLDRKNIVLQHVLENTFTIQQTHAESSQVQLNADLPPLALHLFGDFQQLGQAFGHLIANAIHATPPRKGVNVRLFSTPGPHRNWAVVQIQDSGAGIARDELPLVFEPFFRPSEGTAQSTGLGLTLAKHIIDQHDGLITVESSREGTTFTVQLPLPDTPLPAADGRR